MLDYSERIIRILKSRIGFKIMEQKEYTFGIPFVYNAKRFIFFAFLEDTNSFPFILTIENNAVTPHISEKEFLWDGEKARYLCLLNRENYIASHMDFESKVNFILDQFERLMNLSKRQIAIEMQKEFMYYWNSCSKNSLEYQLFVPPSRIPKKLDIIYIKDEKSSKTTKTVIVKDSSVKLNSFYLKEGVQGVGLFIPISNSVGIIPPHKNGLWDKSAILRILSNPIQDNITSDSYKFIKNFRHKGASLNIVFSMELPSGFTIMFVMKLEFSSSKNAYLLEKIQNSLSEIEYIYSERFDSYYMNDRIGMLSISKFKTVLIAGLGSLGSYIVREMPKIGYKELTLLDPDVFNTGNVMRHTLSTNFKGFSKVNALAFVLERGYPEVIVNPQKKKFDRDYIETNDLDKFDVIIIAVGNTDAQIEINRSLKKSKFEGLVIFTWLEPMGVGSHALVIDYSLKGCYSCLFHDTDGNIIDNVASLITLDNVISIENGCGGSFTTYGNSVLLEATAQVIDIVSRYTNAGKFDTNFLITRKMKIDDSNLKFSDRYINTNGEKIYDIDFISKGCDICEK